MKNIRVVPSEHKIIGGCGGYFRIEGPRGIGVIDRAGKVIVQPFFNDVLITPEDGAVEMFIRRRRVSHLPEGEYVFDFVSTDGELISQDNYGECIGFREGVAIVKDKFGIHAMDRHDKKLFGIDGSMLHGPSYNGLFHDDMLRVTAELGFYSYYVDRDGVKKTREFQHASDFHQELAVVSVERPLRLKYLYGAINRKGQWAISPKYDYMESFRNFRACVKKKGKYGYVDRQGRLRVPIIWDDARDFGPDGLAFVKSAYPPSACIIDMEGQVVLQLPADCSYAGTFYEDMLAAKAGEKWGYIDREGRWAIAPQFDAAGDFSSGVAPVQRGGEWCFIDRVGAEALAIDGRLRITAKGLAYTESVIYDYGYRPLQLKEDR